MSAVHSWIVTVSTEMLRAAALYVIPASLDVLAVPNVPFEIDASS